MAKDPYRYFRIEAAELLEGLGASLLTLERAPTDKEVVARLLRLAHTLKGASRVVGLAPIAEDAHAIEDVLASFREATDPVPQEGVNRLLRLVDAIGARVAAIEPAARPDVPVPAPAPRASDEATETVRVEIDEVDRLLESVSEVATLVNALDPQRAGLAEAARLAARVVASLGGPDAAGALAVGEELKGAIERVRRELGRGLEQVHRELTQVRDGAHRIRLLPASTIFPSLERAARDAAESLGKTIAFQASGGGVRLDAHVLSALRGALIHVVRNAVAHGVEPASRRAAAGKPVAGRVALSVEQRGHRVAFLCQDDGQGIDLEAVRRVALARGLLAPGGAGDPEELARVLLRGGVTTTAAVTAVSGRGVGLDVVREAAERLKGEVSLRSAPGRGVTLEIVVPVSLSTVLALEVDAAGVSASLPLDAVRQTLRLADADIARSPESDSIVYEGNVIPFVPLARALRRATPSDRGKNGWSAVVVQSGAALAAVGVDRVVRTSNVLLRPLPAHAEVDPVVAGAALDVEGHPKLVLDPAGLVAAAQAARGSVADAAPAAPPPILIVDDSLTTRMLEQSILESAGYRVELATSAEEALGLAKERRFALFVVDVEMPGMDGFEFLARKQADPALRETPAILVTSRGSPEDRQRGRDAGARGYIVKGEFDQGHLLQTIRGLVGARS